MNNYIIYSVEYSYGDQIGNKYTNSERIVSKTQLTKSQIQKKIRLFACGAKVTKIKDITNET